MHRRDADPAPIDPQLAVDGVNELLEHFAPLSPGEKLADHPGSIHLHATDTEGEWLVHLTPEGIRFEHGHAKGDAALRGTASDLLLWAWNRAPVDDRFEVLRRRCAARPLAHGRLDLRRPAVLGRSTAHQALQPPETELGSADAPRGPLGTQVLDAVDEVRLQAIGLADGVDVGHPRCGARGTSR